jgi:hypothetical protein
MKNALSEQLRRLRQNLNLLNNNTLNLSKRNYWYKSDVPRAGWGDLRGSVMATLNS